MIRHDIAIFDRRSSFWIFYYQYAFAWPYNTMCCVIILISRIRPEKGEAALHFELLWR
jgi:hypothetical protein